MEWPYDHPRRGEMPPDRTALTLNEYTIRKPPYGKGDPRTADAARLLDLALRTSARRTANR